MKSIKKIFLYFRLKKRLRKAGIDAREFLNLVQSQRQLEKISRSTFSFDSYSMRLNHE